MFNPFFPCEMRRNQHAQGLMIGEQFFCQRVHLVSLHPHQEATCGWSRSIKAWISFISKAVLGRVSYLSTGRPIVPSANWEIHEIPFLANKTKWWSGKHWPIKYRNVPAYFGLWNESATVWDHPCISCNPSDTFSSSSPLGTFFTLITAEKTPFLAQASRLLWEL